MDNSGHNGRSGRARQTHRYFYFQSIIRKQTQTQNTNTMGGQDSGRARQTHRFLYFQSTFGKRTQNIYIIYKAASLEIVERETNCEILRGEEGSVEVRVSPGLSQFTFREGNTQQSENVLRNKNMILRFSLSALLYFVGREYLLTPKRAFS